MEDPVVPLERNLYSHPLVGLLWERQFEKVLLKYGPDCNLILGSRHCLFSCGRCLRISKNEKEVDKCNKDKRGARHGPSERQRIFNKAREMLKRNMDSTHPFLRDGSATKDTESRCRTMVGTRATPCHLTELSWKIINTSQQMLR